MRRVAGWLALLVAGAFAGGAVWYQRSLGTLAEVGRPAPVFVLPDLGGRAVALEAFAGRPVLINFWTTWCDPCREEIPGLETFYRRFGDRMPVVGVNVREPLPTVRLFVDEFAMTYPVVRDADGKVAERYRVRGYPESWLVGEDGVARRFWPGPLTFEQLEQAYREVTGRPITEASQVGGPLPAGQPGVGLAQVAGRLYVASPERLFAVEPGRLAAADPEPETGPAFAWESLPLPGGVGAMTALAPWGGGRALAVAFGSEVWLYEPGGGRWQKVAEAPAEVTALAPPPGGEPPDRSGDSGTLWAWVRGRGVFRLAAGGAATPVELPLSADASVAALAFLPDAAGGAGTVLAGGPAGLVKVPVGASGGALQGVLDRPTFAVAPAEGGASDAGTGGAGVASALLATDRGIYRLDGSRGQAAPLPGTPVRRFRALTVASDGRLYALADNGDLYVYDRRPAGEPWRLAPVPRGRW